MLKNKNGLTEDEFLASYDPDKYERPSVAVDMLIFAVTNKKKIDGVDIGEEGSTAEPLKILMVKRRDHPFIGQWALPGGFVNADESLDEAAARELEEETGITGICLEQLYTWGDLGRDPRTRVISVAYIAKVENLAINIKAGDDAAEIRWFTVTNKLLNERIITKSKGCIQQRYFQISLSNGDENLSAIIEVMKTSEIGTSRIKRDIVESNGIAFDHAKIIEYGIKNLNLE